MYPLRSSFLTVISVLFATTLAAHAATWPCDPSTGLASFPFCDTSLAMETRAKDLVSRLSLAEKAQQVIDNAAGVPRLGIPSYQWWSEALHGVSNVGRGGTKFNATVPGATVFPIPLHSAASFNATLWQDIGKAVSTEARAMHNVGLAGLTFWSPTMNVVRDPRWGRTQETPGEDPYTVGKYSAAYVRGLQGYGDQSNTSRRLKVASCCKHYTAYDLDNWKGIERYTFNAIVTEQDLEDTYNPPFKACVLEGNVASIMCSYNKVNGVPTCANPELLAGTIRGKWGLDGYIVSDCDSVDVFYRNQKFTATPEDAVALAINAGLDLNCGSFLAQHTVDAVNKGKVNESKVDQALVNNYIVLMRLGWFDGNPAKQLYGNLGPTDVCTAEHRALALQAAREGVVLLKNVNSALPLTANGTVAVIGPNANVTVTMIGNYAGIACRYTTPLQGISAYTKTVYAPGCKDVLCKSNSLVSAAVKTASKADATVLVVGGDQSLEAESRDRTSFLLPGYQQSLVKSVADASPGPVVLVIMSGGPFDISFALDDSKISGIFWVGYPGETGGEAIADTIFGAYNPSGRLPVSWYPEEYTKIPMTNMNMRPDPSTGYPGRTYRFYTGKTLFEFGDGLSYTKFQHSLKSLVLSKKEGCVVRKGMVCKVAKVSRNGCHDLRMEAVLEVRNVGKRDGEHVVMFYSTPPAGDGVPKKHLVGFGKVHVKAKGRERVRFSADVCEDVAAVDKGGKRKLSAGSYVFEFGDLQHPFQVSLGDKYEILETTMEEI